MRYYNFDPVTGTFLPNPDHSSGGYEARKSPADEAEGKTYYLIPKWATGSEDGKPDPPPNIPDTSARVAVRVGYDKETGLGGRWEVQEDPYLGKAVGRYEIELLDIEFRLQMAQEHGLVHAIEVLNGLKAEVQDKLDRAKERLGKALDARSNP
jgi:hypothetical protein